MKLAIGGMWFRTIERAHITFAADESNEVHINTDVKRLILIYNRGQFTLRDQFDNLVWGEEVDQREMDAYSMVCDKVAMIADEGQTKQIRETFASICEILRLVDDIASQRIFSLKPIRKKLKKLLKDHV